MDSMNKKQKKENLKEKTKEEFNVELLMNGLNDVEVQESQNTYGTNQLSKKETKTIFQMFLDSLNDIWIKVLIGALFLKIFLAVLPMFIPQIQGNENDFIEIISILLAIILSTGFSTISEYKNTSRSEALQEEYNKSYAKVIRNGNISNILTSDIVQYDVVLVQAGDKVPVDGLIIKGNIKVSQAALNGESRDETKTSTSDMKESESTEFDSQHKVFMGSVVTSGEAYMIATVIGDKTELGKINKSLTSNEEEERQDTSSLKLQKVAEMIGKLGTSAAAITVLLQMFLGIVNATEEVTAISVFVLLIESIMLGASIIIMAVPEGLPMMNSLVQSMNTESMYKKNILVSHNPAFSDTAYMDILFSDKTGTITQGRLSLVEFLLGNGKIVNKIESQEFIDNITLNNASKISLENNKLKAIGSNNMDRALMDYAISVGFTSDQLNTSKLKKDSVSQFDSNKKCATVDLADGSQYWKGATELIIDNVTHYMDESGNVLAFDQYLKQKLYEMMHLQAQKTMKLLSLVKKEKEKVILYAVGCFRDDVRQDAKDTVNILNKAGIQVVMVTGDAEDTAVAIAKEANIIKNEETDIVLTHEELEALSDEELQDMMYNLRVVSRAKPLDKKRLVSISQKMERVAGMTGDGVNDAPALKQADIGFAMGDGTAVAQEAGDIVILNNSLTSIKDCVLNSRTMAKSVGKFLIFQLTVNVSTLLMNILAPILGWMEPFTIVEILYINLIMDTLAALAFGGEPILDRYMKDKPVKRHDNILTKYIKNSILTSSLFITIGSIIILENVGGILDFVTPLNCTNPELYERTFMFAFFIYSIIFNSLNTRSERFNLFENISENKKFIYVMGGIFIFQTILLEIGGPIFGTVPLSLTAYLVSISLAFLIIPVDMLKKAIIKKLDK